MVSGIRDILQASKRGVASADERQLASQVPLLKPSGIEAFQHMEEVNVAEAGKDNGEGVDMVDGTPHIEMEKRHTRSQTKLNGFAGLNGGKETTANPSVVINIEDGAATDEAEDMDDGESDQEADAGEVRALSSCSCSPTITRDTQDMKGNTHDAKGLQLLAKALQLGLHNVCHNHLRSLAKTTVGLQNNMSSSKLRKRLQDAWRNKNHLDDLRRRKPCWFLKTRRPETDADSLVVYRYRPVPPKTFRFDEARVFERFAGQGSGMAGSEMAPL